MGSQVLYFFHVVAVLVSMHSFDDEQPKPLAISDLAEEEEDSALAGSASMPEDIEGEAEDASSGSEFDSSAMGFTALAQLVPGEPAAPGGGEVEKTSDSLLSASFDESAVYTVSGGGVQQKKPRHAHSPPLGGDVALNNTAAPAAQIGVKKSALEQSIPLSKASPNDASDLDYAGEIPALTLKPDAPNPEPIADQISQHDSMMDQLQEESSSSAALPQIPDPNFSALNNIAPLQVEAHSESRISSHDEGSGFSSQLVPSHDEGSTQTLQLGGGQEKDLHKELFENLGIAHSVASEVPAVSQEELQARREELEKDLPSQDIWQGSTTNVEAEEEEDDHEYRPQAQATPLTFQPHSAGPTKPFGHNLSDLWHTHQHLFTLGALCLATLFAAYMFIDADQLKQISNIVTKHTEGLSGSGGSAIDEDEYEEGYEEDGYEEGYYEEEDEAEEESASAEELAEAKEDSSASSEEVDPEYSSDSATSDSSSSSAAASSASSRIPVLRNETLESGSNPYSQLPTRTKKPETLAEQENILSPWSGEKLLKYLVSDVLWHKYEVVAYIRQNPARGKIHKETLWKWVETNEKLWLTLDALGALLALGETVTLAQMKKAITPHSPQQIANWSKRFRSASLSAENKTLVRMLIHLGNGAMRYEALRTLLSSPDRLSRAYIVAGQLDPYPTVAVACERWSRQVSSFKERLYLEKVAQGKEPFL